MSARLGWSPEGAARELLRRQRTGREPLPSPGPAMARFPAPVEAALAARDGGEEALQLARELARCADGLDAASRDTVALLVLAALLHVGDGSTRLPLPATAGDFFDRLLQALAVPLAAAAPARELASRLGAGVAEAPAGALFGGPAERRPFVVEGGWLAPRRLHRLEEQLAARLARRLVAVAAPTEAAAAALADVVRHPPTRGGRAVALSEEQRAAVVGALTRPLTVVSGGPGTGKTSVVVSVLRVLARLGVPPEAIALAAPTGKAAQRMAESVRSLLGALTDPPAADRALLAECPAPRTLHRLLGWSPSRERFLHHEANPLAESVVIVDEGSMIDLELMDRLVRAVPEGARLVLLGDAEQLPSVEAGAVFRDLVPPPGADDDPRSRWSARLTRSYRMDPADPDGRAILLAAQALNAGQLRVAAAGEPGPGDVALRERAADVRFRGVELLGCPSRSSEADRLRRRWFDEHVRSCPDFERRARRVYRFDDAGPRPEEVGDLEALVRHHGSARVLSLLRGDGGGAGAAALNAFFHRLLAEIVAPGAASAEALLPGEPVMMLRNDYERGLFNGDQGLVLRVSQAGAAARPMAVFPRGEGFVAYHLESVRADLEPSFAMTVHKAQGSEFDHAALFLPDSDLALLTRAVLYTALTRSRRSVTVVGSPALLERGASRPLERFCGLGARLRGPAAAPG